MRRFRALGVGIVAVAFFLSCGRKPEKTPTEETQGRPLVKVGDLVLTEEDLRIQVPQLQDTLYEAQRKTLIDQWVRMAVFYLAARDAGLDKDPKVQRKVRWFTRMLLAQEYLSRQQANLRVTDAEIDRFYRETADMFQKEGRFALIIYRDSALTDSFRRLLRKRGKALDQALESLASDPEVSASLTDFVNLGLFAFAELEGFYEQLKALKPGQIAGPISTPDGYILLKLVDVRKSQSGEQEVKFFLRQALLNRKQEELADSLFRELLARYPVQVLEGAKP